MSDPPGVTPHGEGPAGATPPGVGSNGLRARRAALLAQPALRGTAWCRRWAAEADDWLRGLLAQATGGDDGRVALLAVGGYGRGLLAPGSDLDLLLVHDRGRRIGAVAEALWYPIWDEGIHLDHSVRTGREVRAAMDTDGKVALGLLEARHVAGDPTLGAAVVEQAANLWRTRAGRWLPGLDELTRQRHERHGDLAFLLEPDLKEARGGLRDLHLLRALAPVVPVLSGLLEDRGLDEAGETLTAARVEVQRLTGRPANQLLLQDQDAVAEACGRGDADTLMAGVAGAARAVAWASDDGWRRVRSWLQGPRGRGPGTDAPLEPGLVLRDEEVALAPGTDVRRDPSLALRAAAVSAELDRPLARASLDRLATEAVAPEATWPPETRNALVRLLAAGQAGVAAVEALDQVGIWVRLLPEWSGVRNRPQRNAYHRFTVDRHLLETAAGAAALTHRVTRPDLLLLGALLHDIGKGRGGDHTEIGMRLVAGIGGRLGLAAADVATLVALVRLHLLLPDVATRRDLDDPATVAAVAEAVGDRLTLDLLAALTEADSQATGPAAWGDWKAGLVDLLVQRTARVLAGEPAVDHRPAAPPSSVQDLLRAGRLELLADGGQLTVVAPDQAGLLATIAGVLSLSRVTVRTATTRSDPATAMAWLSFDVAPAFDVLPDWAKVRADVEAALGGRLALAERLAERERSYARHRRPVAAVAPTIQVVTDNAASADATVVEVRAPDSGPVLYRVAQALTGAGVTIVSALVTTLGAEAVDAFYVQSLDGAKLADPEDRRRVETAVAAALSGP